jgi:fructokinase
MRQAHLFPLLRKDVQRLLNDYVKSPTILQQVDDYILSPGLGDRAGVKGAIALAQQASGFSY